MPRLRIGELQPLAYALTWVTTDGSVRKASPSETTWRFSISSRPTTAIANGVSRTARSPSAPVSVWVRSAVTLMASRSVAERARGARSGVVCACAAQARDRATASVARRGREDDSIEGFLGGQRNAVRDLQKAGERSMAGSRRLAGNRQRVHRRERCRTVAGCELLSLCYAASNLPRG